MRKYLLITAKIAQGSLKKIVAKIDNYDLEIMVLNYTVAALMSTEYIAKELAKNKLWDRSRIVVIPGLCQGGLDIISKSTGAEVTLGPKNLGDLHDFLEGKIVDVTNNTLPPVPSPMRIVAEIVDAPKMTTKEILAQAQYYKENGADIIDLGGNVCGTFPRLKETICALKEEGYLVSVDSHQMEDMTIAAAVGVDLMLSFTSENIEKAKDFSCPVVVIPDDGTSLDSLYTNIEKLDKWGIPYVADPILPPITMGFAQGISRYSQIRKDFPACEMLLGLGNVTELIDADSTGIHGLMVGVAAELSVNYLLTTEVGYRCKHAVKEISIARELMQRAICEEKIPKHIDYRLLTIKDAGGNYYNRDELKAMQSVIVDRNFRIFVADKIYVFNGFDFFEGETAESLFVQLAVKDNRHAFYLGRELNKAETALRLQKRYVQDRSLDWGYFNEEIGDGDDS